MWSGKIIGAFVGFLLMGPVGGIIGVLLGHQFDHEPKNNWKNFFGFPHLSQNNTKEIFIKITFAVMGYIAKADGRVSEKEIYLAKHFMKRMQLNAIQKQQAIKQFNCGKQPNFNLQQALIALLQTCQKQHLLLQTFIDIQFQMAFAETVITSSQQQILKNICQTLGFINTYNTRFNNYRYTNEPSSQYSLRNAFEALGVSQTASNPEIKKAYRRQMSQYHPDKLTAKGSPKEMIRRATEKTQTIQIAYHQIRTARGIENFS